MTKNEPTSNPISSGDGAESRSGLAPLSGHAPLQLTDIPPKGKRYIVLWLVIVVFAAVAIILGAGIETFALVFGVSVLFVIVVSTLVKNLIG